MSTLVDTQLVLDKAIMEGAKVIKKQFEDNNTPDGVETLCCSLEYLSKAYKNIREY